MLDAYELYLPPTIVFGADSIDQLPEHVPANAKVLLVTGKHLQTDGTAARIAELLSPRVTQQWSDLGMEAPLPDIEQLIELGRREAVDTVVGIGGGSVLDAAKAAAAIIPMEGSLYDYFYGKRTVGDNTLPFIAIPTTAGTGTEITKNAVLCDPASGVKQSIRTVSMIPDVAIIDPKLTLTTPPSITAASGLDALTQAIESFTSQGASIPTKALAKAATKIIFSNLEQAYINPTDLKARTALAEGSMLTGMAFSQSSLGAVHGLAHPIGSKLHLAHGLVCAVLLPEIMSLNLEAARADYTELAAECGVGSAEELVAEIGVLSGKLNIPKGFQGMDDDVIDFVIANCRSGSMKSNPCYLDDGVLRSLLLKMRI